MSGADQDFNWGIVGTGKIASEFASQASRIERSHVHGVWSRQQQNAERFRAAFNANQCYTSFQQMLDDDKLDALYIALPAACHAEYAIAALRAGKPVLCEKPFARNTAEAEQILTVAAGERVFCMEAMWMRFSPLVQRLNSLLQGGELGQLRHISIQAGNITSLSRLTDADPGRGALLNFAVYGVSLVQLLLGDPRSVSADILTLPDSTLDETCLLRLRYGDALASISASIRLPMSNEAVITGTRGRLRIAGPFFAPGFAELSRFDAPSDQAAPSAAPVNAVPKVDRIPYLGLAQGAFWTSMLRRRGRVLVRARGDNGLRHEAMEVMRCVRSSQLESEIVPHRDTLSVMRILDQARDSAGSDR